MIADLWALIWTIKTNRIVMLTSCVEEGKVNTYYIIMQSEYACIIKSFRCTFFNSILAGLNLRCGYKIKIFFQS